MLLNFGYTYKTNQKTVLQNSI